MVETYLTQFLVDIRGVDDARLIRFFVISIKKKFIYLVLAYITFLSYNSGSHSMKNEPKNLCISIVTYKEIGMR